MDSSVIMLLILVILFILWLIFYGKRSPVGLASTINEEPRSKLQSITTPLPSEERKRSELRGITSVANKLYEYRWSLYVARDDKQLVYAMHDDSVIGIVGHVMAYFRGGANPVPPWSLYLNFNKKQKYFELHPEHFTMDGRNVTPLLIQEIESIDPGYLAHIGFFFAPQFLHLFLKVPLRDKRACFGYAAAI